MLVGRFSSPVARSRLGFSAAPCYNAGMTELEPQQQSIERHPHGRFSLPQRFVILCAFIVLGALMFWPLGHLLLLAVRLPNAIWIAPSIFIAIVSIVAIVSVFRAIPSDSRFAKSRDKVIK